MQYDFLIVGAGIAGATCARLLTNKGYKCLIIEERPFVGGMCVTTNVNGIDIHVLGPHVFHTNDQKVWDFVNQYSEFNNYRLKELTFTNYRFYHSRLNLELLQDIYGNDKWPQDYEKLLKEDLVKFDDISNAEEYCLSIFGEKIYETTLKG
jgi:UDP-galactopyranose mutase